jgi:division protein CdvB (Snf7/Vps24/ESCRT-III family)
MDSLQFILVTGLLAMVVINAFSLMWAMKLNRQLRERPAPKVYEVKVDAGKVLADVDMTEIEKLTHQQLAKVANEAGARFKQSIENAVDNLSVHISDMASGSLLGEFEKYQVSLQALRDQSIQEFSKLQKELDERRTQLTEHLDKIIQTEGEKRLGALDERMNDVISSYLIESLGNQVDLGAQSASIFETLHKHKDEIKRDILS